MVAGPEWSDEVIARNWAALRKALPAELLPHEIGSGRYECYGCGSWGCVYPTRDPGAVFKMTTDPSEMDFLSTAAALPDEPGLSHYYSLLQLDGTATSKGAGLHPVPRQAYALVREAADQIGQFKIEGDAKKRAPMWLVRDRERSGGAMRTFREVAAYLREMVNYWQDDMDEIWQEATSHAETHGLPQSVLHRAADLMSDRQLELNERHPDDLLLESLPDEPSIMLLQLLDALRQLSDRMVESKSLKLVGGTLGRLLRRGLVLADVHFKNIGVAERDGEPAWVITDPGHLVRVGKTPPAVSIPHVRQVVWRTSL